MRWKFQRDAARAAAPTSHDLTEAKPKRSVNLSIRARRAIHERDGGKCKKCRTSHALEVHHKLERVFGGGDEPENLDTLCSTCHGEWTWSQPPGISYDEWLTLPPAWMFVVASSRILRARDGADHDLRSSAEAETMASILDTMRRMVAGR